MFHHGAFGGATKRFTYLFSHLNQKYPGTFYYLINQHLYEQINEVFGNIDHDNIKCIDYASGKSTQIRTTNFRKIRYFSDDFKDPEYLDSSTTLPRKIYWYYKNKFRQKELFFQIEKIRKDNDIEVFVGVFSGVLPLVFYLTKGQQRPTIIYSDMDSWFSDIHRNMKKLWYRKFYSFNFALENADALDFLSPFIYEGVRKLGININDNNVFISPCSFTDYSKCVTSSKETLEIAFASRLEPNKNPLLYLRAVKIISKEHPEVKFHLLGEGSLAYAIENFIIENHLNETVNFQFHKNPPEIFKNTSLFVSLQTGTNYPSQSILEAMACENAIIASKTGDTNLFINDKNGILINLDLDELVNSLRKLIVNRELTRKLGMNARNFAMLNHTIERFTDYYIDLLKKVTLRRTN